MRKQIPSDVHKAVGEIARAESPNGIRPDWTQGRRGFLKGGLVAAAALAMPFELIGSGKAMAASLPYSPDYGPLSPVNDMNTGLPLLSLPQGFTYRSYGWTGDMMSDNIATPGAHDGMAVVGVDKNNIVLVRNHERSGTTGSYAAAKITYDPVATGGTTNMTFDPRTGLWLGAYASLGGTLTNCAGGPTPWGTWLTCEETTQGPLTNALYTKQHGWVFEVPAFGPANPQPLTAMGAFSHEATATDPVSGIVYETEDRTPSGFYRFIPNVKTRLSQGGTLQMLKVVGTTSARLYGSAATGQIPNGTTYDVEWVNIADPTKVYADMPPATTPTSSGGVFNQGDALGGSGFARLEGAWYGNAEIWFISTSGGVSGNGQVWKYDPRAEKLTMVYESPGSGVLDNPDNCAWSPRGSLILCEDGGNAIQRMHGLTPDGTVFPFCENQIVLAGTKGFTGDFRNREFAGACFYNQWLFVNVQTPGITFAITGPWDNGAL